MVFFINILAGSMTLSGSYKLMSKAWISPIMSIDSYQCNQTKSYETKNLELFAMF